MKKLLCFLLVSLLGAWGAAQAEPAIRFGLLNYLNVEFDSHEIMEEERAPEDNDAAGARERVFFDSLNTLLMALDAGKIEYAYLPDITAAYVAARNPALSYAVKTTSPNLFKMAVASEEEELYAALDGAIETLSQNGTLDRLTALWITGLSSANDPEPGDMPTYDGEPIRVGISGDQPPLDYAHVDGTPAGFNVAMLAEISALLERPIELVTIESNARVTALTSGKLDAVFWIRLFADVQAPEDSGVTLTRPYFSCSSAFITKDFPMDEMKAIERIFD